LLSLGIDIGSATSKVVIMKDGAEIIAKALHTAGIGSEGGKIAMDKALADAGLKMEDIDVVTATGYGRNILEFADYRISELSCHGKGAHFLCNDVRTLIDVGGQDAKVVKLDSAGRMLDFVMNDKCAAGTGRFMEVMARVLSCDIDELSALSANAEPAAISSICTVFAETEVISRLAAGIPRSNIAAGVNLSVAKRVYGLASRCGVVPTVMMSGGVAKNASLVKALSEIMHEPIIVDKDCQYCGAIGAALLGFEKHSKK